MSIKVAQLHEIHRKLYSARSMEYVELQRKAEAISKELGFGKHIREIAEATRGKKPFQTLRVSGEGEHALVMLYKQFQIVVHIADDPALFGDGSRVLGWWKRRLPPNREHEVVRSTERWLQNRAVKRRLHQAVTPSPSIA